MLLVRSGKSKKAVFKVSLPMWDIRQDTKYAEYMRGIGWSVDVVRGVYCYSRRFPFMPLSVTKIQRPQKRLSYDEVKTIVKKNRSILVYLEPVSNDDVDYYEKNGFKTASSPMLPTKTIIIDLTLSQQKLLNLMHSKTRYNIGYEKAKKHTYSISNDSDSFAEMWQKEAKKRGMFISLKREIKALCKSFGDNAEMLMAYRNTTLLGGVLLIHSKKVSYYMYAFSTDQGKKDFAPTGLVWQSLLRSKMRGSTSFDFEGVYDKRAPLPAWKGFTRFKSGFGGKEIEYHLPLKKVFVRF